MVLPSSSGNRLPSSRNAPGQGGNFRPGQGGNLPKQVGNIPPSASRIPVPNTPSPVINFPQAPAPSNPVSAPTIPKVSPIPQLPTGLGRVLSTGSRALGIVGAGMGLLDALNNLFGEDPVQKQIRERIERQRQNDASPPPNSFQDLLEPTNKGDSVKVPGSIAGKQYRLEVTNRQRTITYYNQATGEPFEDKAKAGSALIGTVRGAIGSARLIALGTTPANHLTKAQTGYTLEIDVGIGTDSPYTVRGGDLSGDTGAVIISGLKAEPLDPNDPDPTVMESINPAPTDYLGRLPGGVQTEDPTRAPKAPPLPVWNPRQPAQPLGDPLPGIKPGQAPGREPDGDRRVPPLPIPFVPGFPQYPGQDPDRRRPRQPRPGESPQQQRERERVPNGSSKPPGSSDSNQPPTPPRCQDPCIQGLHDKLDNADRGNALSEWLRNMMENLLDNLLDSLNGGSDINLQPVLDAIAAKQFDVPMASITVPRVYRKIEEEKDDMFVSEDVTLSVPEFLREFALKQSKQYEMFLSDQPAFDIQVSQIHDSLEVPQFWDPGNTKSPSVGSLESSMNVLKAIEFMYEPKFTPKWEQLRADYSNDAGKQEFALLAFEAPRPFPAASILQKQSLNLISLLARLGLHRLPATVPERVHLPSNASDDDKKLIKIDNLLDYQTWQFKQMDEAIGTYPIEIKYKDAENVEKTLNIPNLAESQAELIGLLLTISSESDIQTSLAMKTITEVIKNGNVTQVDHTILEAITEFLGFRIKDEAVEVPYAITPGAENLKDTLKESKKKIVGKKFDDKDDLMDHVKKLLLYTGIIKSVFYRKNDGEVPGDRIRDDIRNGDDKSNDEWTAFINLLKNPPENLRKPTDSPVNVKDYSLGVDPDSLPT